MDHVVEIFVDFSDAKGKGLFTGAVDKVGFRELG
jgi:hypothetical protein